MRIGIDCIALQSDSRNRGIGRFAKNFLDTLLNHTNHTEHTYILYIYDGLPVKMVPTKNVEWRTIWPGGNQHMTGLQNGVYGNPDELNALLLLSPGESYVRKDVGIPRLYSVVYDLIPLIFKDKYLADEWFRDLHYKYLNAICEYDHLFTLSESARDDILREIPAVSRERVSVIGSANDPLFSPANSSNCPSIIDKPFFLHIGGDDDRKGGVETLKAFAALPNRDDLKIVFSYGASKAHREKMVRVAESLGIKEHFIFHPYSSEGEVCRLYSQCISMVFPSQYEGFGLPILEAMSCGASVVAGNNSSQVELVRDYGILTDPHNIEAMSAIMYILSTDDELNQFIQRQCLARSKDFSWGKVADKFLSVIKKPRLAVFSPVPPVPSGISDYIVNLMRYLSDTFEITIYTDNYAPDPLHWKTLPYSCFNPKKHDHIIYQMGNSEYHRYMYPYILKYSGVVTLHDFCLAGFHNNYDEVNPGHFKKQVELAGEKYDDGIDWAPEGRVVECVKRGLFLNEEVTRVSRAIITHSARFINKNKKTYHIPFPKELVPSVPLVPQTIPPIDPITIIVPGWLSETKMNQCCLEAFALMDNPNTVLVFAGDGENGKLKEFVSDWGIEDRVIFTGRLTKERYDGIIREADLGIILRKPPTNGETSAALFDLLAAGVPTIVSQVGYFEEVPGNTAYKFKGDCPIDLCNIMDSFVNSEKMREEFGRAGRNFVRDYHNPEQSAEMYTKIILGSR